MKEGVKEGWPQEIVVQDISLSNTDKSAASLNISDSSLHHSRGGPVTSTPFVSRKASPSRPHPQEELSFDLDALDPDLIALLRPNSFQHELDRAPTPPEKPFSHSKDSSALKVAPKKVPDGLGSPPISPIQYDSDTRRYSKTIMLPSPPSPVRPGHLSRFQLSQQTPALSHAPKPTIALNRIPWLDSPESDAGQMSSGPSTVSSSNLATPSDFSKPPSPLVPLQHNQQRRPEPFVVNRSSACMSRHDNTQPPSHSMLPSPIEPRPTSRVALKNINVQLASRFPLNEMSDNVRRPKNILRNQTLDPLRSEARPSSADPSHSFRPRGNSSASFSPNNERSMFESRRYRKRSMSVDQAPDLSQLHRDSSEYVRPRDSEYAYKPSSGRDFSYDGRGPDHEEHSRYDFSEIGRDRTARLSPEWLGPRTVKAFAAAGLLDDPRENTRYVTAENIWGNSTDVFSNF